MRILIVKLSAIGDVVHALAVLDALRRHFPEAHIGWLVEEAAAGLLYGHPQLDRVIVMPRKSWLRSVRRPAAWAESIRRLATGIRLLRDTRYDVVIDLQAALKSSLPIRLCRADRIIGHDRADEHSHLFLTERVVAYDREEHAIRRYLDLAHYLGVPKGPIRCLIPADDAVRRRAAVLLRDTRIDLARPFVAINPVAKWESKLWLTERFAELADRCIRELEIQIVFTGSGHDAGVTAAIASRMRERCSILAGKSGLQELAQIYRLAGALITTDTGPMHIAAAVETPVIALFGPTAPWRTGPFGSGHHVLRSDASCSPCFKRQCSDAKCMRDITVNNVFDRVAAVLRPNHRQLPTD